MASIQQPCDLFANQQIKQIIKGKNYEYHMSLKFHEQTKVKVPYELFALWVESTLDYVHKSQLIKNMGISKDL
jgi:hypothetical protein